MTCYLLLRGRWVVCIIRQVIDYMSFIVMSLDVKSVSSSITLLSKLLFLSSFLTFLVSACSSLSELIVYLLFIGNFFLKCSRFMVFYPLSLFIAFMVIFAHFFSKAFSTIIFPEFTRFWMSHFAALLEASFTLL